MYPVFESIKIVNQEICNFEYHLERMNRTSWFLWSKPIEFPHLESEIKACSTPGINKCKLFYNQDKYSLECFAYNKRVITTLYILKDENIFYPFKLSQRECINKHLKDLSVNEDILIIKNGRITDSSYSNIALWNGHEWHTPIHPLLPGTKRKKLIDKGIIQVKDILAEHLYQYEKVSLINAMLSLGEVELSIKNIIF